MLYNQYLDTNLSRLGLGCMRLPVLEDGKIDKEQVFKMVDIAIANGINYFDTAWPYHGGESELVIGEALKRYPRDSFYLATKFPGHSLFDKVETEKLFNKQLEKLQVEYFDYYLLHNFCENSIKTYEDPRWGIIDYLVKQKQEGRIRHLGMSSHASLDFLKMLVEKYGDILEFVQIQLNYLDWTMQKGKEKYEFLKAHNIGVWVMEPVRGGRLANLDDESVAQLKALRPDRSPVDWCFDFLLKYDGIKMILSGMSNIEQLEQNINTFNTHRPLSDAEEAKLLELAEKMKNAVPCTACGYCKEQCPMQLDIPHIISLYNDLKFMMSPNIAMQIEAMDDSKKPSACIGCYSCTRVCPQGIEIPKIMTDLTDLLSKMPTWREIARQREEQTHKALDD
ncbi:MAG: aldo/keto reductase [Erysipelotrichaceae bacterium]|nr:aldo/keto reductase [Erysipelotrichaceae bacterium]